MSDETKSLITVEVGSRIDRRLEFAQEDGNLMRANSQYTQYVEDVNLLLAEVTRLHTIVVDSRRNSSKNFVAHTLVPGFPGCAHPEGMPSARWPCP